MGLPFDLEDIVGAALADVLRRAGLIIASILGSSFLVCLSAGIVVAVVDFQPSALWEFLPGALFLFLLPVVTGWAVLYVPTLVAAGFYFVKAESPTLRGFVIFCGILGVLMVVAPGDFDLVTAGIVLVYAGFLGGLWWLGLWWSNRQAVLGEQHLMEVAIENQQRREAMRREFGTAVADRDYVVEEE